MSLIRPVLRMCAVAALRSATWAEGRVYDSDNTPLLNSLLDARDPFIVVYTDDDTRSGISGRDIYASPRALSLVLEIGCAIRIEAKTAASGSTIDIPATDEGMEFTMDVVETQALSVVLGNPKSPWAEVIRRIVNGVARVNSVRGGSANQGSRWAARQVTIVTTSTISDPAPGVLLDASHPVRKFIELATADEYAELGMVDAARLIESMISDTADVGWRQAQALLGLTEKGARALGIAPFATGDETAAGLSEVLDTVEGGDIEPYNTDDVPFLESDDTL